MTNQLKTELAKINQGCGYKSMKGAWRCGTGGRNRHLCPSCKSKKQGLIQGAKIMIENQIKFLEYVGIKRSGELSTLDLKEEIETKLSELKQLNNWLEKE